MTDPITTREAGYDAVLLHIPHEPTEVNYHEWVTLNTRLKIDRTGRINQRLASDNATLWRCNNPDCSGQAIVPDAAIVSLIYAATPAEFDVMADRAWAANRPDRYIAAIRDLRIADSAERPLRDYKDAIDAARKRAGDE